MEKVPNFQDDQHVPPPASAPSYDEAMKCSQIPLDQMASYPKLVDMQPAATPMPMPTQMPMPMPTQMPMAMPQPMQQMVPSSIQQMPSFTQS